MRAVRKGGRYNSANSGARWLITLCQRRLLENLASDHRNQLCKLKDRMVSPLTAATRAIYAYQHWRLYFTSVWPDPFHADDPKSTSAVLRTPAQSPCDQRLDERTSKTGDSHRSLSYRHTELHRKSPTPDLANGSSSTRSELSSSDLSLRAFGISTNIR